MLIARKIIIKLFLKIRGVISVTQQYISSVEFSELIYEFIPYFILNTISYPLFASADTGIYPHAASQYHARPKAKRGIAMLSVDKFPYPR